MNCDTFSAAKINVIQHGKCVTYEKLNTFRIKMFHRHKGKCLHTFYPISKKIQITFAVENNIFSKSFKATYFTVFTSILLYTKTITAIQL